MKTFFRKLRKIYNIFYYRYFAKNQFHTVVLRGDLDEEEQKYFDSHESLFLDSKKYFRGCDISDKKNILEIGFGNGSHPIYLAKTFSEYNIFGVEMDKIGIVKTLKKMDALGLSNFKIFREDARIVVQNFPKNSLDNIFVLFPDPWRKKRDGKKRLLRSEFIFHLVTLLKKDGQLVMATDWAAYADFIFFELDFLGREGKIKFEKVVERKNTQEFFALENYDVKNIFETKFAQRAKNEGRDITIFKGCKMV